MPRRKKRRALSSFSQDVPRREERGALRSRSTSKSVFTDTHSTFIGSCFSQGSDLWIRNTHRWFVECTQSVKRGMLGERVRYKCIKANVQRTEGHIWSLLRAVPHIKQPWPLQYEPSHSKCLMNAYFSTCFSCRTSWLFLLGRTFPADVNIWTFLTIRSLLLRRHCTVSVLLIFQMHFCINNKYDIMFWMGSRFTGNVPYFFNKMRDS